MTASVSASNWKDGSYAYDEKDFGVPWRSWVKALIHNVIIPATNKEGDAYHRILGSAEVNKFVSEVDFSVGDVVFAEKYEDWLKDVKPSASDIKDLINSSGIKVMVLPAELDGADFDDVCENIADSKGACLAITDSGFPVATAVEISAYAGVFVGEHRARAMDVLARITPADSEYISREILRGSDLVITPAAILEVANSLRKSAAEKIILVGEFNLVDALVLYTEFPGIEAYIAANNLVLADKAWQDLGATPEQAKTMVAAADLSVPTHLKDVDHISQSPEGRGFLVHLREREVYGVMTAEQADAAVRDHLKSKLAHGDYGIFMGDDFALDRYVEAGWAEATALTDINSSFDIQEKAESESGRFENALIENLYDMGELGDRDFESEEGIVFYDRLKADVLSSRVEGLRGVASAAPFEYLKQRFSPEDLFGFAVGDAALNENDLFDAVTAKSPALLWGDVIAIPGTNYNIYRG